MYSISQDICTGFPLLCFLVVIHWLIFPYPPGLLRWHCGNLTIAPVPAKQPWWIWINTSCEIIMNDYITTRKQSTTKPCAYFLGYTVCSLGRLRPTILRGYNYVSMPHPRYWFNWPLLVKGTLELHWLCFEPQPYFQANVFRYANARLYTIKLSKLYKFGIQAHHRVSHDIHWAVFEYESHVQESRQYAVEQRTLQVNYIHGPLLKISSEATPSWGHEILNISIDCCGIYLPITATTFTVVQNKDMGFVTLPCYNAS